MKLQGDEYKAEEVEQFNLTKGEEEEEEVLIASAKGRNGPESPYTQVQKGMNQMYNGTMV